MGDHLGGVPSLVEHFGHIPVHKFMPQQKEALFGGEGAMDPDSIWPAHKVRHSEMDRLCGQKAQRYASCTFQGTPTTTSLSSTPRRRRCSRATMCSGWAHRSSGTCRSTWSH